jgi:ATP adenylyltransferase
MDQLWAPWRLAYVSKAAPSKPDECFICSALAAANDRENLVAQRTSRSIVMLNRFPYNNGHLLIAPQAHKGRLEELGPEELLDGLETVRHMVRLLEELIRAEGFNIGLNLGRVAGAGLPGHLHWHVVPRWNGDTNFMPVLGDAKVIAQSLDALWEMLTERLKMPS